MQSQCDAVWKQTISKDKQALDTANEYFKQELKLLGLLVAVMPFCLYQSIETLIAVVAKLYGWIYRGFHEAESPASPRWAASADQRTTEQEQLRTSFGQGA